MATWPKEADSSTWTISKHSRSSRITLRLDSAILVEALIVARGRGSGWLASRLRTIYLFTGMVFRATRSATQRSCLESTSDLLNREAWPMTRLFISIEHLLLF